MARCKTTFATLVAVLLSSTGCATVAPSAETARPAAWASPVAVAPGLPNLFRVNATLYRSAQPARDGFVLLGQQASLANGDPPIRTVLSLRAYKGDAPLVPASAGLRLEQVSFKTWHPETEDVVDFLRIVSTAEFQPVLVHCRHGSDRTGMMVAIYRIVVEGWTKAQAIDEMVNGGYGYHPVWRNLVRYIDALDVDAIRAELARTVPG
ncbi:MAG: tyrosine-protein phosphatase [Steroidobacteraceae bacterium]